MKLILSPDAPGQIKDYDKNGGIIMTLSMQKVIEELLLAKRPDLFVGPEGTGENQYRMSSVRKFIKSSSEVWMPIMYYTEPEYGSGIQKLTINSGRHTLAVLREIGHTSFEAYVPKRQEQKFTCLK